MKEMLKNLVIFGLFLVVIVLMVGVPESGSSLWNVKFIGSKILGMYIGGYMVRLMLMWKMFDVNERV